MDGIKLIKIDNNVKTAWVSELAGIEYQPETRYMIDKQSVYDPEVIIRRGAYHDDVIDVELFVEQDEFSNLISFLNKFDKLFLEYYVSGIKQQYPVMISKLPKQDDSGRYLGNNCKLSFRSVYTELNMIDFEDVGGYGFNFGNCYGH